VILARKPPLGNRNQETYPDGTKINMKKSSKTKKKPLTAEQKWRSLKAQTERAGMTVTEEAGKIIVRPKSTKKP